MPNKPASQRERAQRLLKRPDLKPEDRAYLMQIVGGDPEAAPVPKLSLHPEEDANVQVDESGEEVYVVPQPEMMPGAGSEVSRGAAARMGLHEGVAPGAQKTWGPIGTAIGEAAGEVRLDPLGAMRSPTSVIAKALHAMGEDYVAREREENLAKQQGAHYYLPRIAGTIAGLPGAMASRAQAALAMPAVPGALGVVGRATSAGLGAGAGTAVQGAMQGDATADIAADTGMATLGGGLASGALEGAGAVGRIAKAKLRSPATPSGRALSAATDGGHYGTGVIGGLSPRSAAAKAAEGKARAVDKAGELAPGAHRYLRVADEELGAMSEGAMSAAGRGVAPAAADDLVSELERIAESATFKANNRAIPWTRQPEFKAAIEALKNRVRMAGDDISPGDFAAADDALVADAADTISDGAPTAVASGDDATLRLRNPSEKMSEVVYGKGGEVVDDAGQAVGGAAAGAPATATDVDVERAIRVSPDELETFLRAIREIAKTGQAQGSSKMFTDLEGAVQKFRDVNFPGLSREAEAVHRAMTEAQGAKKELGVSGKLLSGRGASGQDVPDPDQVRAIAGNLSPDIHASAASRAARRAAALKAGVSPQDYDLMVAMQGAEELGRGGGIAAGVMPSGKPYARVGGGGRFLAPRADALADILLDDATRTAAARLIGMMTGNSVPMMVNSR